MNDAIEEWFVREVLVHEAALTRYLRRAWGNEADVPDLRQEVYIRVLEAGERVRPTSPKRFMFIVARNLLADHARRNRIVPIDLLQESDTSNVLVDEISSERRTSSFQQLQRLVDAFERLPDRCREVVWMRKIEDVAQKEIAKRLTIAEGTVEAHLVRGMRMLAQLFHGGEADEGVDAGRARSERESQHGQ
jgi:RNA polymerase sigma-70 factor (ECF subfamily)